MIDCIKKCMIKVLGVGEEDIFLDSSLIDLGAEQE
jgi:hypothetical protein